LINLFNNHVQFLVFTFLITQTFKKHRSLRQVNIISTFFIGAFPDFAVFGFRISIALKFYFQRKQFARFVSYNT